MMAAVCAGIFRAPCPAWASPGCDVDRLLAAAHARNLHEARYWHILMHYEKKLTGVVSQVDDPDFFLAPDGKTNPRAELDATIAYLFADSADTRDPDTTDPDAGSGPKQQEKTKKPICRFYARYGWLEKKLGHVMPACFAGRSCPAIDRIEPQSASLVFPTYYLNNPASMFGHTLLTIDTAYTSKRLSNAVNYAAFTEGRGGFSLAVSGLTGLYRGYYSVMPYYKKIQEYSDINQRDIWEYELDLSPAELRRMVRHIREMDGIYSDYYFFDENCSYNLLYLIEAARPSLRLVDRFHLAAIPVDTIKAVEEAGLIRGADFRPAKTTRIQFLADRLRKERRDRVRALVNGRISPDEIVGQPLPRQIKIRMLDLAVEVIQYRYVNKELDQQEYRDLLLAALKARSGLGRAETDWEDAIPAPPRPEKGHDSKRLSAGPGLESGDLFYEIRFRPALTDLTDMDYIPGQGAQLEFFDLRGRYYPEDRRLLLQQADVVDIVSISPRSAFFKPLSWKANTGWHRKPLETDENALYYRLNGGAGVAGKYADSGIIYLMAESELDISGDLEADYAIGAGAALGTILPVRRVFKLHLYGRALGFFMGDTHADYTAAAVGSFKLDTNHHLSVSARWTDAGAEAYTVGAIWHWFF